MNNPNILLFCLFPFFAFSQSNEQLIISTQGNFDRGKTITLSWTIGDLVTETGAFNDGLITQGFQQPFIHSKEIESPTGSDFEAKVFPNPFESFITVSIQNHGEEYLMDLFDLNGKLLWKGKSKSAQEKIEFQHLPAAQYVLRIGFEKSQKTKVFEITKAL